MHSPLLENVFGKNSGCQKRHPTQSPVTYSIHVRGKWIDFMSEGHDECTFESLADNANLLIKTSESRLSVEAISQRVGATMVGPVHPFYIHWLPCWKATVLGYAIMGGQRIRLVLGRIVIVRI